MVFNEHGQFKIVKVSEDILFMDAIGPFNDEIGKEYVSTLKQAVTHYQPKAQITTVHFAIVLSPTIEQAITKLNQWKLQTGLTIEAFVLDANNIEKKIFIEQIHRIMKGLDCHYEFFEDETLATKWALSLIE